MAERKLQGGCQCGAIRYEVVGTPKAQVACHCTACQRQSGSAFGMTIVVNEEDFRLIKGELKTHASKSQAGRAKSGAFCPECGTRIYHKSEWRKGTVSVKPGTLDDTRWLNPEMHLWTSSKQPWVSIPERRGSVRNTTLLRAFHLSGFSIAHWKLRGYAGVSGRTLTSGAD